MGVLAPEVTKKTTDNCLLLPGSDVTVYTALRFSSPSPARGISLPFAFLPDRLRYGCTDIS
jgi:hypothetical protein